MTVTFIDGNLIAEPHTVENQSIREMCADAQRWC